MSRVIGVEIVGDASSVERAFGSASRSANTFQRDLSKTTRGALAGSGIFRGLGRSLAFASGGFLAVSSAAAVITDSIKNAESLQKAQEGLSVAIQHTHGNITKLIPRYAATAKAAAQFGVNEVDATTALERATVITGNAGRAQRAYREALDISKATGKDFNSVLLATSKAQEGQTTALSRYIGTISKGTPGTKQFVEVMAKFGGQAKANTSATEKLRAELSDAETTIGTALLPTVDKIATSFANWLDKMNRTGRLEHDVAAGMSAIQATTGPLIKGIKELTGAVGALSSAWDDLKKAQSGGGIKGFFAGQTTGFLNFAKTSVTHELFPIEDLLGAFQHKPAPPPPSLKFNLPLPNGGSIPFAPTFGNGPGGSVGPFGNISPIAELSKFALTVPEQLAQARSALTKSTADDVAAAKGVVARVKRLISEGRLKSAALIQALQAEGTAVSTIQSAEAAAAQARLARLQAAIDPLKLEVQLSKDQALGVSTLSDLRALKAAAEKALASGNLPLKLQQQAWEQIKSVNDQITQQLQQGLKSFTEPIKLQIALAREQAFGKDTTKTLLAMKRAALKALKSGNYAGQALIDLLDEITSINQQLGSTANGALGGFKQANTQKLTAGLGLTAAQRKALRARLAQLGPGGTTPGDGVGAFGVIIGPDGKARRARHPHAPNPGSATSGGATSSHTQPIVVRNEIDLYIDGKKVTSVVTKNQQRRARRNPTQRRGPNAATR